MIPRSPTMMSQNQKTESDEKRLKSLMEKKMTFKMREGLIRQALNTVDQKPLGKKIIFTDDVEGDLEKANREAKKQKRLFDDDEDDDDKGENNILENGEFRMRENVNKKLRKLQSNFGNDERFTLDNRFVEDEDKVVEKNTDPLSELQDERNWQLDILQNVLGKPMKPSGIEESGEKKKMGMMRYDPTKKDHADCEITVQKYTPKKSNKVKKNSGNNDDIEKDKLPKLSKDTFFNVSDNLADTLKQDGQFSLLKTFGNAEPTIDDSSDGKMNVREEHQFNFDKRNPFKYDSSDNESVDEGNAEKIDDAQNIVLKNDWNDSLFFDMNDVRFDDGRKFFGKESKTNSEFSTLRRNLKQIVRTKIQNNLRKKVTWKKIKQRKS